VGRGQLQNVNIFYKLCSGPLLYSTEYYFDNILKPDHLLRIFIFMVFSEKIEFGMGEGVISLKRGVERPQKAEGTSRLIPRTMILFQPIDFHIILSQKENTTHIA
jgi:hypothetical protein